MSPKAKRLFNPSSTESFALSRTKLDDFLTCPRCFYLDRRVGITKPSLPAFTLNSAVDALLKKEFDAFRAKQEPHPIMPKYGVVAVPFQHPGLDIWRNNFKGIRFHHAPSNLILFGAVDDIWVEPNGELLIVDYKATSSKEEVITLNTKYRQGYKRQLEIYQWLFLRSGFEVSRKSYILYANAMKDRAGFNGRLEFDLQLIEHLGDDSWIELAMLRAKECLMNDAPPHPNRECEWCRYRDANPKP